MVKRVIIDGVETQYYLFDDGALYNEKTHRVSTGAIDTCYLRYTLQLEDRIVCIAKHQLLAQCFIPNPQNKLFVRHKDGCLRNNSLDNLEWADKNECCNNQTNPVKHTIIKELTEEELLAEEWRPFRDTIYEVSNMGRIKNTKTGYITFGSQNKNTGYIRWTFTTRGGRQEIQAHRAIYEAFHPDEEINVINHIDSNRGNNRLSNLENISQSENIIKSYYQTKTKTTKLTGQYDLDMNLINVYPSTSEAARQIGLKNASNLSRAMKEGWKSHGYYWRELTQEQFDEFLKTNK